MARAFITWGGWNGHEPEQTANICANVLEAEGHDVTVSDSLEPLADDAFMAGLDLVGCRCGPCLASAASRKPVS